MGRQTLAKRPDDVFEADSLFALAEAELLAPLDAAAAREVEAAARQVATVTALVPLALADIITALTANLRMIRRIAEIYGGRGRCPWRLASDARGHDPFGRHRGRCCGRRSDRLGPGGLGPVESVPPLWRRGCERRPDGPRGRRHDGGLPPPALQRRP